jgi:hypothetical protein
MPSERFGHPVHKLEGNTSDFPIHFFLIIARFCIVWKVFLTQIQTRQPSAERRKVTFHLDFRMIHAQDNQAQLGFNGRSHDKVKSRICGKNRTHRFLLKFAFPKNLKMVYITITNQQNIFEG